jgi:Mg-chelatase subunit ChlD
MNDQKDQSTHIVLLLDRSGSMQSIRQDVIGGWNSFLSEQQKVEGHATLTQVQFDTQNSFEVVYHFQDLKEVDGLTLETFVPRGGTPLLDALGQGMTTTAMDIASRAPGQKPEKVLFVCITDGQENSSTRYRKGEIAKMMENLQGGGWSFVFLSSSLDAVRDAENFGFKAQSVMQFAHSSLGVDRMMKQMSAKVDAYRNASHANAFIEFSQEDRAEAMDSDGQTQPDGGVT